MVLFVLAGSLAGCLERSGGVRAPRWDADGRHVFYLEQRLVSTIDTSESYHLYRARPDLSGRAKLAAGKIYSMRPSFDYRSDTEAVIVPTPDRSGFTVIAIGQALGGRPVQRELGHPGAAPSGQREGAATGQKLLRGSFDQG